MMYPNMNQQNMTYSKSNQQAMNQMNQPYMTYSNSNQQAMNLMNQPYMTYSNSNQQAMNLMNQLYMTFLNSNQQAMNQMNKNIENQASDSLYRQYFQQTFQNLQQPEIKLFNVNFNDMTNILSLLNLPIIVPYHENHPLVNCRTIGRDKSENNVLNSWKCNKCYTWYYFSVPTFYCTACDFDLCQKCLLSLNACYI